MSGRNSFTKLVNQLKEDFKKGKKEKEIKPETQKQITPGQEEIIKALENKANKVGFETNVRLLVSSASQSRAEQLLGHLESAFAQFNAPNLNGLKAFRLKGLALKRLIYQFTFRLFNKKQSSILNTEELTGLFHFPQQLCIYKIDPCKTTPF